ncbi:DUF3971 domain-containing protein [Bradyrhizobium sp. LHD-71]|uniref:YhdP family protein n=1 Tax=Bradyrhizobium sp. LHD-71 TaxID=3072141 RepID=UPI00280F1A9B|nr:DUF3971 domain-containing protein [Bradyrhizobium sp. LHD-71]MDQ8729999.1 DUF3971 domain-containing protein [Bradyrhizobium sp. LHD-71]
MIAVTLVLAALAGSAFGLLWWRLGEGPIGFDVATPWLTAAIKDNVSSDYVVEIGGTQIERAGPVRIAVRVLDIVVRDRDNQIVATAPKAEVRISSTSLLLGRLRAESLSLVDAELSVLIEPDGRVSVSTGTNARPLVTATPSDLASPPSATSTPPTPPPDASSASPGAAPASGSGIDSLLAALARLDGISAAGLDGYDLNEIGIKNGNVTVDDRQSGNHWSFENINLSVQRPSGGGIALSVGEENATRPWSFRAAVGAQVNGVRSVEIAAERVLIKDMLFALRLKDASYTADLPVTGRLRGEIGRDGLPTYFTGKIGVDAGSIVDRRAPEYPMNIDRADISVDWDSTRRVLVAPFQVVAGQNRITLLAHLEPPNDTVPHWQLGLSGGTIVLPGHEGETPLIFNRIAIRMRFDIDSKRIVLTQGDISNGTVGVAGTGTFDYSTDEPRLTAGLAGTPMSASDLKRLWPVIINPEVREWVLARVDSGFLQRAEIAINAPTHTLARGGPPIPEEGLSINFVANNVKIRPVDGLPPVTDAGMRVRITGRTANVSIAQAAMETAAGRKIGLSDFVFEIPDLAPKPMQTRVRFRVDAPLPAVAEILSSDRWSEFSGMPIDPNSTRGATAAVVTLAMPLKTELTKQDTAYTVSADLNNVSVEKLVMSQRLESNNLKLTANNQGYQIKGEIRVNGQSAALDYRKPMGDPDAEVRVNATLDDAGRTRLGIDLGPGATGNIPLRLNGKIGPDDQDTRFGVEADLSGLRIDNLLPGWVKSAGRPGRATFNIIRRDQSIRFEEVVIEGGGASIKGSLELDDKGDLISAVFPTYQPSEGDRASLRAERMPDGALKIAMRGDVFDGRSFIKASIGGSGHDKKQRIGDFEADLKFGAVAGHNGEAMRGVDIKLARRGGVIRTFALNGKIGRDTKVLGDIRGRQAGRVVIYLETADAGALFRFTDMYSKMYGGQMWIAMDPPIADSTPQEGLLNVSDFTIRGEAQLQQLAAQSQNGGAQTGLAFSRMRAEFTRSTGALTIREGLVAGLTMGATIEGNINYAANQVRMSGTFLPAYGLNNIFGQIPIVGLFLGGGSNEGLIGITYEVVGTPGSPTLRVNPISAVAPGVLRKIFEFGTGRQPQTPLDSFSSPQQN